MYKILSNQLGKETLQANRQGRGIDSSQKKPETSNNYLRAAHRSRRTRSSGVAEELGRCWRGLGDRHAPGRR